MPHRLETDGTRLPGRKADHVTQRTPQTWTWEAGAPGNARRPDLRPLLGSQVPCQVLAVLLHYFFLSAFAWMLVEGLHLYSLVIRVFGSEDSKLRYYYGVGWGRCRAGVGAGLGEVRGWGRCRAGGGEGLGGQDGVGWGGMGGDGRGWGGMGFLASLHLEEAKTEGEPGWPNRSKGLTPWESLVPVSGFCGSSFICFFLF